MTQVVPARERIMAAARELFYAYGMNTTGIDTITARAGVARKSLYNNFASKDDLVAAYIEDRHQQWLTLYDDRVQNAVTPGERVLAVFDAYIDHAEADYPDGFRGCGLLNAAAEFPAGASGREAVRRHKEHVEHLIFTALPDASGNHSRELLAEHLSFLLEGAVSRAGLEGVPMRLHAARAIAASLLGVQ